MGDGGWQQHLQALLYWWDWLNPRPESSSLCERPVFSIAVENSISGVFDVKSVNFYFLELAAFPAPKSCRSVCIAEYICNFGLCKFVNLDFDLMGWNFSCLFFAVTGVHGELQKANCEAEEGSLAGWLFSCSLPGFFLVGLGDCNRCDYSCSPRDVQSLLLKLPKTKKSEVSQSLWTKPVSLLMCFWQSLLETSS